jgi:hypothetical protein
MHRKPLTGEEQLAALGNIGRKPHQGDLFKGEFDAGPTRRGNGRHVRLTREEGEPVKAIGMAHFPGTGPDRTYCRECKYCQDIDVWRGGRYRKPPDSSGKGNVMPVRTKRNACLKAAELLDGIVQRGGIGANRSCKYFEARSLLGPQEEMAEAKSMDAPLDATNVVSLPRSD